MLFSGLGYNCEKDIILNTIQHELSIELSKVFNIKEKSIISGRFGEDTGKVRLNTYDGDKGVLYFDIEYEEDYNLIKKCLNNIIKKYNLNSLQGIDFSFICKEEKKLLYDSPVEGKRFTYYSIYLSFSQNFYHLFEYCCGTGYNVDELYLNDDIVISYDIFEDRIVKKVYANNEFINYGYSTMGEINVDNDKLLNDVLSDNFDNIVFKYNYHNRPFKNPMEVELGNSTVDVARNIRSALKVICKDIKFSVRKSNFNKINVKTDEALDKDLAEYIKKTIGCFNHQSDLLSKYGNDLIINFNF